LGDYAVGIYTLYISITGIVSTFFESGLLMHAFPGILEAHKDGELVLYRKRMREFLVQSLVISLVLIVGAFILFHALLMFGLIKSEYGEESMCFIVMLLGVLVKNMSFTPHYGLYVNGQDSKILLSSAVGFFLAVSLCVILIPKMGILGAAVSLFIANLGILAAKTKSYMDYSKAH
jgi:O-antigen/teichoic acid export membrane protein